MSAARKLAPSMKRARKPRKQTPLLPQAARITPVFAEGDAFLGLMRGVVGYVLEIDLPVRTYSEMNVRGNRWKLTDRKQEQKSTTSSVLAAMVPREVRDALRPTYVITMTRLGPKRMDSDAACISMKFCRDTIAKWLPNARGAAGIDDGDDDEAEWRYAREIAPVFGVRVRIERKAGA